MTIRDFIEDYKWWYENKHHNTGITVVYLIAGLMQDILIEMELIERRHGNEN